MILIHHCTELPLHTACEDRTEPSISVPECYGWQIIIGIFSVLYGSVERRNFFLFFHSFSLLILHILCFIFVWRTIQGLKKVYFVLLSSYVFEEEGIRRLLLSDPLVRDPIESTRPSSFLGTPDDIELAFSKTTPQDCWSLSVNRSPLGVLQQWGNPS